MTLFWAVFLVVLLVAADQLTKLLVLQTLADGGTHTVISHALQFRYVENTGMAFSMLENHPKALAIFSIVIIAVVFSLVWKWNIVDKRTWFALLLLAAGGLGNAIDRFARGFVVDFIEVTFMNFAVFNVADCFVTVGAILLIVFVFMDTLKGKDNHE